MIGYLIELVLETIAINFAKLLESGLGPVWLALSDNLSLMDLEEFAINWAKSDIHRT